MAKSRVCPGSGISCRAWAALPICRFARPRRAGDEEDAMRLDDDLADGLLFQWRKAEFVQAQEYLAAREQPQRDALAIDCRHRGDADVDFLALDAHVDAPVLRQALLGDIQIG